MTPSQSSPYHEFMAGSMGDDCYCPFFQHSIEVVGRRWTGSIVRVLADRPRRFGEIRDAIPGLSDRLLDSRLRELVDEGIVERREAEPSHYALTSKGEDLGPVLDSVEAWASTYAGPKPASTPGRIQSA